MNGFKRGLLFGVPALVVVVLAYAVVIRPYHLHWGATAEEVARSLPGDALIPPNFDISTRAITIHAPVATVWAWVVQLGQGRGGFYSYDWLENLFAADMQNADRIKPELQNVQVGDPLLYAHYGSYLEASRTEVVLVARERAFVIRGGWGLYLEPIDAGTTRLIVRYPLDPYVFGNGLMTYGLFEPVHFVMESGMMLGIKTRAEAQS